MSSSSGNNSTSSSSEVCEVAVLVERVDQRRHDLAVAQRKVAKRELRVQVIAQRAGRDLLRREILVVVRRRSAEPQSPSPPRAGRQIEFGRRAVVAIVARRRLGCCRTRCSPPSENSGGGSRRLVLVGFFEQRIFLQQALDLGVELERRKLQQPDRLLQLRGERQVLRELELEGLLHGRAFSQPTSKPEMFPQIDLSHAFIIDNFVRRSGGKHPALR